MSVKLKMGICCGCHSEVPLQSSSIPLQEEQERGFDEQFIRMDYGDSIDYLVVEHEFYGQKCEGSGQIPQVVLK